MDIEIVKSLNKYFELYSYCPNCKSGLSENALRSLYSFGKFELPVNESNANNSVSNCINEFSPYGFLYLDLL